MNVILLSGGSGKRLWPLSNEVRSKQFLKIFKRPDGTHESMVQRMYRMIHEVDKNAMYDVALLIAPAAFAGIIFTLLKRISVNNKLWNFLGNISFEIYLVHELIYNILRNGNRGIYVSNNLLYVTLVIFISIGCAYLFNAFITRRLVAKILS